MRKDLMVDLETWGTIPNAAIRSIAAVSFDKHGRIYDHFYINVADDQANRQKDKSTIDWWSNQAPEALAALTEDQVPLQDAIQQFQSFVISNLSPYQKIWANSPSFDLVIIKDVLAQYELKCQWEFWQEADLRTLMNCVPYTIKQRIKSTIKFEGNQHNALDDCLHQIKQVNTLMAWLEGK